MEAGYITVSDPTDLKTKMEEKKAKRYAIGLFPAAHGPAFDNFNKVHISTFFLNIIFFTRFLLFTVKNVRSLLVKTQDLPYKQLKDLELLIGKEM